MAIGLAVSRRHTMEHGVIVGAGTFIIGALWALAITLRNPWPALVPLTTHKATPQGIEEDGVCTVKPWNIRQVRCEYVNHNLWRVRVHTWCKGTRVYRFDSEAQAAAWMHELNADEHQARATFGYRGPKARRVVTICCYFYTPALLFFVFWQAESKGLFSLPILLAVLGLVLGLVPLAPAQLKVGLDGYETRWLLWKRFVRFGDVKEIALESPTIRVLFEPKPNEERLPALLEFLPSKNPENPVHEVDQAFPRMVRAWKASRVAASREDAQRTLQGVRVENIAGLQNLRSLAQTEAGYRRVAVDTDALLGVALDPTLEPGMRAKAAAALSTTKDAQVRIQLQIAANTCVDERLRSVLAWDPNGEDETLIAQLRKL
jgi:hypothetical protein